MSPTIEGHIKKYFGPLPKPSAAPARPSYPVPDHAETLVSIAKDKELTDDLGQRRLQAAPAARRARAATTAAASSNRSTTAW